VRGALLLVLLSLFPFLVSGCLFPPSLFSLSLSLFPTLTLTPTPTSHRALPLHQLCGDGFSVTRRRHHCRACGRVACQPCAKYRGKVEGSAKEVRLCRECKAVQQAHVALAKFVAQLQLAEEKGMVIEELIDWQDAMLSTLGQSALQ
jgi:hypothetical protein